jgi:hypothetical protein
MWKYLVFADQRAGVGRKVRTMDWDGAVVVHTGGGWSLMGTVIGVLTWVGGRGPLLAF